MIFRRIFTAGALVLGLSACAATVPNQQLDTASRASATPEATAAPTAIPLPDVRVRNITVVVPRSLKVNEKNSYYPSGDIVWREDPIGSRYEQVQKIMEDGLRAGTDQLTGSRPVDLYVEVVKFHALSDKARYSVGGLHAIRFKMTLLDPRTGEALVAPRLVSADFEALGGKAALAADIRGITQKSRIQQQLAHVIQIELTVPGGYKPQAAGFLEAVHKL